eukprot:432603-Pyramimonas_sp.AAC.1
MSRDELAEFLDRELMWIMDPVRLHDCLDNMTCQAMARSQAWELQHRGVHAHRSWSCQVDFTRPQPSICDNQAQGGRRTA